MYQSTRIVRAKFDRMQDAIGLVGHILGLLQDKHGANIAAAVSVGGDPSTIAIASRWDDIAGYQAMREAMAADTEIIAAMRMVPDVLIDGDTQDSILKVDIEAGEAGPWIGTNTARMELARVDEAMAFAVEAAGYTGSVTGKTVGLSHNVTGDRARVMWINYGESLADLVSDNDKLESDTGYLELFKKSDGLFLSSTLEQGIWQSIFPAG